MKNLIYFYFIFEKFYVKFDFFLKRIWKNIIKFRIFEALAGK